MTQEDKELLLKDLCARLPYSTLCYCKWVEDAPNDTSGCIQEVSTYLLDELMIIGDQNYECQICEIKPYLRQMFSMTEEEKEEFEKISHCSLKTIVLKRDRKDRIVEQKAYFDNEIPSSGAFGDDGDCSYIKQEYFINLIDWLNAHHFDYRRLIEKGLAIEAQEGMYNIR